MTNDNLTISQGLRLKIEYKEKKILRLLKQGKTEEVAKERKIIEELKGIIQMCGE